MTVKYHQAKGPIRTLFFLALVLLVPAMTAGQTRSDTGRHKPEPPSLAEEDTSSDTKRESTNSQVKRWYFGFSGGAQSGSDLYRVEVADGTPVPWEPVTGDDFESSRFTAALDRNFSFGLFVGRDLSAVWSVRADLGYSRMDVNAQALVDQSGAVFLLDRMSVLNLGLGAEARLTQASSYPFFQASVLVSRLGPDGADALAQSNWGALIGLGYLHSFQKVWGLRLEARLARTGFSVGDYVPQSALPDQPELVYTSEDHLTFFEFRIGIQAEI